jgi:hypothetical protein
MDVWADAALLWRRILTTEPHVIFGPEAQRLLNRNWADRLPQPGYMGLRYRPGRFGIRLDESWCRAAGRAKPG